MSATTGERPGQPPDEGADDDAREPGDRGAGGEDGEDLPGLRWASGRGPPRPPRRCGGGIGGRWGRPAGQRDRSFRGSIGGRRHARPALRRGECRRAHRCAGRAAARYGGGRAPRSRGTPATLGAAPPDVSPADTCTAPHPRDFRRRKSGRTGGLSARKVRQDVVRAAASASSSPAYRRTASRSASSDPSRAARRRRRPRTAAHPAPPGCRTVSSGRGRGSAAPPGPPAARVPPPRRPPAASGTRPRWVTCAASRPA